MPFTCPTNNSASEKFWIPFFDHKSLVIEKKKKSQLLIIEYLQGFRLLKSEMDCPKCLNKMAIKWKGGYYWR
jgi:hypothetical protein